MTLQDLHKTIKSNFIKKRGVDVIEILGIFNEEFSSSSIQIDLKSKEIKKTIIELSLERSNQYLILEIGNKKISLDTTKEDINLKVGIFVKYLNNILEQEKVAINNDHIFAYLNGKSTNPDYIQVLKRDVNIDDLLN